MFSKYFKDSMLKGHSRADIVLELKNYHNDLSKLDNITLSRWLNNKTTPSLDKQVLIALATNTQDELLHNYKSHKFTATRAFNKSYNNYASRMDVPHHQLLYQNSLERIHWEIFTWEDYLSLSNRIRNKISTLRKLNSLMEIDPLKPCELNVFYVEGSSGDVVSFAGLGDELPMFSSEIGVPNEIRDDCSYSVFSFFASSKLHFIIAGLKLNFLFDHHQKTYHCIPARGHEAALLLDSMGFRLIAEYEEHQKVGNYSFYLAEVHKLLGHPMCFQAMLRTRRLYLRLKKNLKK